MMLATFAAAVVWIMRPDPECTCDYRGWRLSEEQIVELDERLALPKGAGPRESYVRYYAGHETPEGKRVLLVSLIRKGQLPLSIDPEHDIVISYSRQGPAYVPTGAGTGCAVISGSFDGEFKPIEPIACTTKATKAKGCDAPDDTSGPADRRESPS